MTNAGNLCPLVVTVKHTVAELPPVVLGFLEYTVFEFLIVIVLLGVISNGQGV